MSSLGVISYGVRMYLVYVVNIYIYYGDVVLDRIIFLDGKKVGFYTK